MTTTTAPSDTFTTPCPPWCTLSARPIHRTASEQHEDGRESRCHSGPNFGTLISTYAAEYTDAPGLLEYATHVQCDGAPMTSDELIVLARHAMEAAAWLEARA